MQLLTKQDRSDSAYMNWAKKMKHVQDDLTLKCVTVPTSSLILLTSFKDQKLSTVK